jgi:hypothetical protein
MRPPRRDGCGFLLLTCFFSCFFLVLNAALVTKLYPVTLQRMPPFHGHPRLDQMVLFLAPVLLLFCEWWLVDRIVEAFTHEPPDDGARP